MKIKAFITAMFCGPDGNVSSKRTIGFVFGCCAIAVAAWGLTHPNLNETFALGVFGGFLTASLAAYGLTSFDAKSYWKSVYSQNSNGNNLPPLPSGEAVEAPKI